MGLMDRMMKYWIDKMSPEEKQRMMNTMMQEFLKGMSKEEKRQLMSAMMDTFMREIFSGMTQEDKSQLMAEMMPKMMQQMFGGEGEMPSMMEMMKRMMGVKPETQGASMSMPPRALDFKPWELCQKMAKLGFEDFPEDLPIPERTCPWGLYGDWVKKMDEEVLQLAKGSKTIDPKDVAKRLNISEKGAIFFLTKLAREGRLKIRSVELA